ncbi:hypothetical protein N7486_003192 [Penicillium sp. IBT 16267x]|nr:hypothetical protein N7486_003192 [Penicillium sp. IBT 16267x]
MSVPAPPSDGVEGTVSVTYEELLEMIIFNLQTAEPPLMRKDERDYLPFLKSEEFCRKFPWLDWPGNYVDMRGYTGGSLGDLFGISSDPDPVSNDLIKYRLIPDSFTPAVYRFEEFSLIATLYKIAQRFKHGECCRDDMVPYPEPVEAGILPDSNVGIENYLSGLTVNDQMNTVENIKAKTLDEPEILESTPKYSDEGPISAGLEYLNAIRNGPANKIGTCEYIDITVIRTVKGVEKPEKCSINPPSFIADNGNEELDPEENIRRQIQGTPEYLNQWEKYNESPEVWPVVMHGIIEFPEVPCLPDHPRPVFDPNEKQPIPGFVRNPIGCYQHVFWPNWDFQIPKKIIGDDKEWQFHRWLSRLPETAKPQDIHHHAFFDGTASADGGYGFMIQGIQHLEAPRDMSDGETRLHWHETAAGHALNMSMMKKLWSIQRAAVRYSGIIDEFSEAWKGFQTRLEGRAAESG